MFLVAVHLSECHILFFISGAVPFYAGVSLMKNPQNTIAYQGKDPTIKMECFPNRR